MINERYIINKLLGEGRSKVFLCDDIDFPEKKVALKVLPSKVPEEELLTFRKEYFTLQKLQHPNIINAIDFGTVVSDNTTKPEVDIGSKFITLEVFEGKELLDYKNCRDEIVLKDILIQICSVLYYLHQSNYIYYDLKPENILVTEVENKPVIKLIDLGFARHVIDDKIPGITGTMQYLAPELLKKESYDHRIDLYSLGMLLYRIIYESFPFETDDQIKIIKAQIDKEFDFPKNNFSKDFINIVKKLLIKDPSKRYQSCLELLSNLGVKFENEITNQWMPAKVSADRKDTISILKKYLDDHKSNEIFSVRGTDGSGKSTIAEEIYANIPGSIIIRDNKNLSNTAFVKFIIKQIIYNDHVYSRLNHATREKVELLFKELPENLIDELKIIVTNIAINCKFSLILDDFNKYDTFTHDTLITLLPILQVNRVNIILTENSDEGNTSSKVHNLQVLNLSPLTEQQLEQLIIRSLHKSFPQKEIKNLIMLYADLLPGGVRTSIKDMLLLNILEYGKDGVKLNEDKKSIELLKSSQEEIYKIRLKSLNEFEQNLIQLISAIDIDLGANSIAKLISHNPNEIDKQLLDLQKNEIIKQYSITGLAQFSSDGLKAYVYSLIENKEEYHLKLAVNIESSLIDFNKNELARQYELAKEDEKSYTLLMQVVEDAEKISAYSYEKQILEHLLELDLTEELINNVKFKLAIILNKLSDFKTVLKHIDDIDINRLELQQKINIHIVKANSLIEIGEMQDGIKLLNSLIKDIQDDKIKLQVYLEIARAELDLGNYVESEKLCNKIISNNLSTPLLLGKCYGVLGLINIYKDNNYDDALIEFTKAKDVYNNADIKHLAIQMENNIGNIYSIKGDYENAESNWNKALDLNKSIGNLNNEGKTSMSFGLYYYERLNYNKALEYLMRAKSIFRSIGDILDEGLIYSNLGEIYINICEYDSSLECLKKSLELFKNINNMNEYFVSQFYLGQLYLTIGDMNNLKIIINEFESIEGENEPNDQNKNNFSFLKLFIDSNKNELSSNIRELNNVKNSFLLNSNLFLFFYAQEKLIYTYINNSMFEEALAELENDNLKDLCSKNKYYNARRDVLLGDLARQNTELKLNSAIEYYEKAYEFIEDFTITELTWKTLYKIADFYFERGNKLKAKEFANYTKATIEHIAEKITDANLLQNYLTEEIRQKALKTIGEIIKN